MVHQVTPSILLQKCHFRFGKKFDTTMNSFTYELRFYQVHCTSQSSHDRVRKRLDERKQGCGLVFNDIVVYNLLKVNVMNEV